MEHFNSLRIIKNAVIKSQSINISSVSFTLSSKVKYISKIISNFKYG